MRPGPAENFERPTGPPHLLQTSRIRQRGGNQVGIFVPRLLGQAQRALRIGLGVGGGGGELSLRLVGIGQRQRLGPRARPDGQGLPLGAQPRSTGMRLLGLAGEYGRFRPVLPRDRLTQ